MSKVITFSRVFPAYHPKAGQPTYFVEKIYNGLALIGLPLTLIDEYDIELNNISKFHTIRSGNRWKVGDKFSPRVWSGKPYCSKMITIAPDIEIKKIWDFKITTEDDDGEHDWAYVEFLGKTYTVYGYGGYDKDIMLKIAQNDGLSISDFYAWFLTGRTKQQRLDDEPKIFNGQIICWNENIEY